MLIDALLLSFTEDIHSTEGDSRFNEESVFTVALLKEAR